MGGVEGNRGYLVQAIIALLHSLEDLDWLSVSIEPNQQSEKVDIEWRYAETHRAAQVKSSQNQITKSMVDSWASELAAGSDADIRELILVGPASQSVVQTKNVYGVDITGPKNLDFEGMVRQTAHEIDKFLGRMGLQRKSAEVRELMAKAMITELQMSASAILSRQELENTFTKWLHALTLPTGSSWSRVTFEAQRGVEHAVAGIRLGPRDVEACPRLPLVDEVFQKLDTDHIYGIVGVPGCGKSITAWQIAKQLEDEGYAIFRPRIEGSVDELVDDVPGIRAVLVIDDAQRFGDEFAARLSDLASPQTKILLVSTIDRKMFSNSALVLPEEGVRTLREFVVKNRKEVLQVVHKHDSTVGDRYFDASFDRRIEDAANQKHPWEFFWVLRGGWKSARREFESLGQFEGAQETLSVLAIGQFLSCDRGVSREWGVSTAAQLGHSEEVVLHALRRLSDFELTLTDITLRTKHLTYASSVIELAVKSAELWRKLTPTIVDTINSELWDLKGISWLLGQLRSATLSTGSIRTIRKTLAPILVPLVERCEREQKDLNWASGAFSRLVSLFDLSADWILQHQDALKNWIINGGRSLAGHFCGRIINELINSSQGDTQQRASALRFINELEDALVAHVNGVDLEGLPYVSELLDRVAYFRPEWYRAFLARLDWDRMKNLMLNACVSDAGAISSLLATLTFFENDFSETNTKLTYVRDVSRYAIKVLNEDPIHAMHECSSLFEHALGFNPRFFRRGKDPTTQQLAIASSIFDGVSAEVFAEVINQATSSKLEHLARSFYTISEVKPALLAEIAKMIDEEKFYSSSSGDWRDQTEELNNFLRCFCVDGASPADRWIEANKHKIRGPVNAIIAGINPQVGIEKSVDGDGVELVYRRNHHWIITCRVLVRLAVIDQAATCRIVSVQLPTLVEAAYGLILDSMKWFIQFLRILHELDPQILDDFVQSLDLDTPKAQETIGQLVHTQRKEIHGYRKLAHAGMRQGERIAELSQVLLARLDE